MKRSSNILLMLPVFNEEETVACVLKEVQRFYKGDILLVDDGSTDASIDKAKALNILNLKIIHHNKNMGYGQSIVNGFDYAINNNYDILITMDCDAQHEPEFIPSFINKIIDYDIVSGSRYLVESKNNNTAPSDRIEINQIITNELNALTHYHLTDSFCGFKAYKVSTLKKIKITEMGYGMPLQFLVQAFCKKLSLVEIPVTRIYYHLDRSFGLDLDVKESRLQYYRNVIKEEVFKCR